MKIDFFCDPYPFKGQVLIVCSELFVHDVAAAFDNIPEAPAKQQCRLINKNRMANLHGKSSTNGFTIPVATDILR